MVFDLQSLLDLRRDAESAARRVLEERSADLRKEEAERSRMVGHLRAAEARLGGETRRLARDPTPSNAAQGLARESYLARLRNQVARLKAGLHEHEATVLAPAQASHQAALSLYQAAVRDCEAVSKLAQAALAASEKAAARRAEEAATDLAAAFRSQRRPTDR